MNIISLLSSSNYIVVNKDLIREYGINVTLMLGELASEYSYWENTGQLDKDGLFYSTIENIENNTGLSRRKQADALKKLEQIGIVDVVVQGCPATRYFRLNTDQLSKLFSDKCTNQFAQNEQTSLHKTDNPVCSKRTNQFVQNVQERIINNTNKETVISNTPRKEKNKQKRKPLDLESVIASLPAESQDAVREFVEMRERIKKPIATENTLKRAIKRAKGFAGDDTGRFTRIFEQSVDHSWQDVYQLKEDSPQKEVVNLWDEDV